MLFSHSMLLTWKAWYYHLYTPVSSPGWGCLGMHGNSPHTKFVFFSNPHGKILNDYSTLGSVPIRNSTRVTSPCKIRCWFPLNSDSVPIPMQQLALVSLPTQVSNVGTLPHAKFRGSVRQGCTYAIRLHTNLIPQKILKHFSRLHHYQIKEE